MRCREISIVLLRLRVISNLLKIQSKVTEKEWVDAGGYVDVSDPTTCDPKYLQSKEWLSNMPQIMMGF